MSNYLNRILMAYRPLALRGMLLDGQYRFPADDKPSGGHRVPGAQRPRSGLVAGHAIAVAARHFQPHGVRS